MFTEHAGEGTELAAAAARKGVKLIIACGGDGTISEVANGILISGKDSELGLLPSGTGGDFRKSVGVPRRVRDAAEILRTGRTRRIDVGRVTFTTTQRRTGNSLLPRRLIFRDDGGGDPAGEATESGMASFQRTQMAYRPPLLRHVDAANCDAIKSHSRRGAA